MIFVSSVGGKRSKIVYCSLVGIVFFYLRYSFSNSVGNCTDAAVCSVILPGRNPPGFGNDGVAGVSDELPVAGFPFFPGYGGWRLFLRC